MEETSMRLGKSNGDKFFFFLEKKASDENLSTIPNVRRSMLV